MPNGPHARVDNPRNLVQHHVMMLRKLLLLNQRKHGRPSNGVKAAVGRDASSSSPFEFMQERAVLVTVKVMVVVGQDQKAG
jgi:hypothetical protein